MEASRFIINKGCVLMKPHNIIIKDNVSLYYVPTKKFKTTTFSIYIHRPLSREEATLNALISMLIRRGCPQFPESKQLSRHLDNLYGVSYSTNVRKKAERQIICANFQFVNEKFIVEDIDILSAVISLAQDSVLKQVSFNEEYVKQEKENLKQQILSVINDKRQYAAKKCIEIMCADEPYGISKLGYIEDLDKITGADLFEHYKNVVTKSPVDIFVCGDVDIKAVEEKVRSMFEDITVTQTVPSPADVKHKVAEVKRITEEQPVAQGKLCIGFRTNVFAKDEDYPAMMLYNSILGSGIFSKLFNNVREKLSLCYYASSSIDQLKGIMTINSGIEVENFQKAYDEIFVQMEDIKNGNISDMEMSAAVLGTVNSLNSIADSPFVMDDYYLGKIIAGEIIDIDELGTKISAVTKEQVMEVAKKIELDTVFFLKGNVKGE